jgi:hypothetical protein
VHLFIFFACFKNNNNAYATVVFKTKLKFEIGFKKQQAQRVLFLKQSKK